MKLIDLHPKYVECTYDDGVTERYAISFDCPKCLSTDLLHKIVVPFTGRFEKCIWQKIGDDFETMTLSPSIWVNKGGINPTVCDVHFFVRNGMIEIC